MKRTRRTRSNGKKPKAAAGRKPGARFRDFLEMLLPTVVLALFATTFSVQAFEIPSESMENTLLVGERVFVDKSAYAPPGWLRLLPYADVRRGDIVVFKYPPDPSKHYVKRVAGIPGDRIRLRGRQLWLNGRIADEPYTVHQQTDHDPFRDDFPALAGEWEHPVVDPRWAGQLPAHVSDGWLVVPPDHYFALGDNRDNSLDSRSAQVGLVHKDLIIGKAMLSYWPSEKIGIAPNGSPSLSDEMRPKAAADPAPDTENGRPAILVGTR